MISIDKYAYQSKLRHIDPIQKVLFALLTLSVCVWANNELISVGVVLIMGCITAFAGGTPLRIFIRLLMVPVWFLLIGAITIAVGFSAEKEAFFAAIPIAGAWIGFSRTGLEEALRLFLKALGAVSCLYFLSLSTPMVAFLAALRRLRVPGLLVELMGLVYRFIFVLLDTANTIHTAQSCRLGYSEISGAYRSLGMMASAVFIRSYKRSEELYTALESRGYEGELNVLEDNYTRHWIGYALGAGINVILVSGVYFLK